MLIMSKIRFYCCWQLCSWFIFIIGTLASVFNSHLVGSSVLPLGVIMSVGQMVSRLPHCPASRNIVASVPTPVHNAYIEQFGTSAYKIALFHQQRDETSWGAFKMIAQYMIQNLCNRYWGIFFWLDRKFRVWDPPNSIIVFNFPAGCLRQEKDICSTINIFAALCYPWLWVWYVGYVLHMWSLQRCWRCLKGVPNNPVISRQNHYLHTIMKANIHDDDHWPAALIFPRVAPPHPTLYHLRAHYLYHLDGQWLVISKSDLRLLALTLVYISTI